MATRKKLNRYSPSSENFAREEFPFYWIARLGSLYTLQMERALKKVGSDIPNWRILTILKEHGRSSISEISVHAIAKLSTITKIVYRMKSEGLVDTVTSELDGRVTVVILTQAGADAFDKIQLATQNIFVKSFRGLTEAQILRLNRALSTIFNNLTEE
jgi:DNA-binding MarR family transcriptional regulator